MLRHRPTRYWTHKITIATVTPGGRDPDNPTGIPLPDKLTLDQTRKDLAAVVQSMDRKATIEANLDTEREHWWIRARPEAAPITQTSRIVWDGLLLEPESTNPGHPIPGKDLQLILRLAPANEQKLLEAALAPPEPDPEPEPDPGEPEEGGAP